MKQIPASFLVPIIQQYWGTLRSRENFGPEQAFESDGLRRVQSTVLIVCSSHPLHSASVNLGIMFSVSFAVSYGTAFACVTATLSHALIYFRKPIMSALRRARTEPPDIHTRLMVVYPSVPEWWYACVLFSCLAAACVTIEVWDYHMTIWALFVSLGIAIVYIIPVGELQ
jgi:hypothetical protein